MDIGIMIAATAESGDIAEIAREVEELGYESFFIPEHPVIPIGFKTPAPGGMELPEHYGRWMDPFVGLSVAAAVTKRVKLGTGICLLPEREPILTAKVIATLDVISGGRVILGVGAGWLKEETEVMGTQFTKRWKRLRETTEAMRVLWSEKEPAYKGELVSFHAPALRSEAGAEARSADPAGRARTQGAGARGAHLRRMVSGGGQARILQARYRRAAQAGRGARTRPRQAPDQRLYRSRRGRRIT